MDTVLTRKSLAGRSVWTSCSPGGQPSRCVCCSQGKCEAKDVGSAALGQAWLGACWREGNGSGFKSCLRGRKPQEGKSESCMGEAAQWVTWPFHTMLSPLSSLDLPLDRAGPGTCARN